MHSIGVSMRTAGRKLRTSLRMHTAGRMHTCTELVLKIMDAGYCLYVHIFMKNIKSLKGVLRSKK